MPATTEKNVTQDDLLSVVKALLAERGSDGANAMSSEALASAFDKAMQKSERRTNPSNPNPPMHSAFEYPDGGHVKPKPTLTCETWFNNSKMDPSQMTPFEILTVNSVRDSLPTETSVKTARGGKWKAFTKAQGTKMYIVCPCATEDDRLEVMTQTLPMICKELIEGPRAADPNSVLERMAEMEAEIARLKAATPAPVG